MTTNYYDTFIEVADDCPLSTGTIPPVKTNKTVAQYQYEILVDNPYRFSSDDVLFMVHAQRGRIPESQWDDARAAFFAKDQPCFRASPLTKSYGWGIHCNHEGRIALVSSGTEEYARLQDDPALRHLKAMKSRR